jgi:hypothetical protein
VLVSVRDLLHASVRQNERFDQASDDQAMQRSEDVRVAKSRAQALNCRVVPPFGDLDGCLPKERVRIRPSPWRSSLDRLGRYGACSIDASSADERHYELRIVGKGTRRWIRPEFRRLFQVCDSICIPSHS